RRIFFEISEDHAVERALAEDRSQTRIVLVHAVDHAEPVLAVVDLDALEAGEPVVGLDERGGDDGSGLAVGPAFVRAHPAGQRPHDHAGGETLEGLELGEGLLFLRALHFLHPLSRYSGGGQGWERYLRGARERIRTPPP